MLYKTPHRFARRVALIALSAAAFNAHAGLFTSVAASFFAHQAVGHAQERVVAAAGIQPTRYSPSPAATVALPPGGSFASCRDQFPGGQPLSTSLVARTWLPVPLCSSGFAVLYSGLSKTPLVTVERLSKSRMAEAAGEQRTEMFFPDPRLEPGIRAELSDYHRSGYDRGHMAPAGDQPDAQSMAQSFALSNMIPQDPENNQKIWSKIESDVRKYARRAPGNVFVYTGPIFDQPGAATIGHNQVWVPSRMFKLVYDEASNRSWAYILPNRSGVHVQPPISYDQFVSVTGLNLLK